MRSGFERTIAADLKRAKVPFEYESKRIPYVIHHTYSPDIIFENGVHVELKGYFRTAAEPAKYRAVKSQHPDLDLRFCFMYPHRTIPGQKTTYAAWAERHGFPWCDGKIPEDWYAPLPEH